MYALWHAEVVAVAMNRDAISRRIRALRAKTVENGCTEAEALAAAQLLADALSPWGAVSPARRLVALGRLTWVTHVAGRAPTGCVIKPQGAVC